MPALSLMPLPLPPCCAAAADFFSPFRRRLPLFRCRHFAVCVVQPKLRIAAADFRFRRCFRHYYAILPPPLLHSLSLSITFAIFAFLTILFHYFQISPFHYFHCHCLFRFAIISLSRRIHFLSFIDYCHFQIRFHYCLFRHCRMPFFTAPLFAMPDIFDRY